LDLTSRTFLVKQNQQSAYIKLDLGGFTDEINVFSAQPKTLNQLDEMIASEKYHDAIMNKQPEIWLPAFLKAVRGTGGHINLDIDQFNSK
jgi:type IV secretory pathway VirB4 component